MEDVLRSAVALYVELFPTAPSLGADRKRRPSTPCMPENHSGAEAANVGLDIGGGDPSDIDNTVDVSRGNPSGADGAVRGVQYREGKERPFHIAAATVLIEKDVRGPHGLSRHPSCNIHFGTKPQKVG